LFIEERMLEICDDVVEFDLSENLTRITIVLCGPLTAARGKLAGIFAPRSGCSPVCVEKTTSDANKIITSPETALGRETIQKSFRTNFQVAVGFHCQKETVTCRGVYEFQKG